jgi:hypothetical protein
MSGRSGQRPRNQGLALALLLAVSLLAGASVATYATTDPTALRQAFGGHGQHLPLFLRPLSRKSWRAASRSSTAPVR